MVQRLHLNTFWKALSMHKKDENCESTKTKPGDSENDHTVFESVAPSKLISNKSKQ